MATSQKSMFYILTIYPMIGLLALILDLVEFIIIFFGLDDFGILDIIGTSVFGFWLYLRTKKENELSLEESTEIKVKNNKNILKKEGQKILRKILPRIGMISFSELIPYLGGILFGWTALVINELIADLTGRNFLDELFGFFSFKKFTR